MTDPAALLASQAEEIADSDTIPVLRMVEILALWGEALTNVLDQHKLVHDEVDRCRGCWNAVHDNYERWPCPTIRAITTALEAS